MSAPKRLLEDPDTAAALRSDLHTVASHQVNFDLAAGLARFEAGLAAGTGASAAGLKATLLKLGIAGVVAGGAVVGVALWSGNALWSSNAPSNEPHTVLTNSAAPAHAKPPSAAVRAATPAPAPAAPSVAESATPGSAAETEPTVVKHATARPAAKARPAPAASPSEKRDDLLQREVQQLRQIRQLVSANPGQALALANEGHSTFKGGVLYQEREALALQALSALGRRSELEARGERYLRAFPNGSFSNRIRQLLGR